ncbi:MAG: helix-turn-helix domain-containing protein [Actinobacteria bacterium]|nr:helix-turn-helix domain-containing protein [Actinomycetota bacterium]
MSEDPDRHETSGRGFLEAVRHPIRSRVIVILEHEWASAAAIAAELGEPTRTVRYHLRFLRERGFVSVRRAEARRNVHEYSFAGTAFGYVDDELYATLTPAERRLLTNHYLRVISRGVNRFVGSGTTYDRHFPLTARVSLALDERGWGELIEICSSALEQIVAVKREARQRLLGNGEDGIDAEVGLLAFEAPREDGSPS